jgi:hypothetical protein
VSSEERDSFETEWVRFRDEIFRKLDLEFSIRLGLLASDERMDPPNNVAERMHEEISLLIESKSNQIKDDLFNRARQEGVGFYTYAMFEVYETSNRLALEVVKSACKEGRHRVIEGDLSAAIEALEKTGAHWPFC